jgi:hypothetical protein
MTSKIGTKIEELENELRRVEAKIKERARLVEERTPWYANMERRQWEAEGYRRQAYALENEARRLDPNRAEVNEIEKFRSEQMSLRFSIRQKDETQSKIDEHRYILEQFNQLRAYIRDADTSARGTFNKHVAEIENTDHIMHGVSDELMRLPNSAIYDSVKALLGERLRGAQDAHDRAQAALGAYLAPFNTCPRVRYDIRMSLYHDLGRLMRMHSTDHRHETYDGGEMGQPQYGGRDPAYATAVTIHSWSVDSTPLIPCFIKDLPYEFYQARELSTLKAKTPLTIWFHHDEKLAVNTAALPLYRMLGVEIMPTRSASSVPFIRFDHMRFDYTLYVEMFMESVVLPRGY